MGRRRRTIRVHGEVDVTRVVLSTLVQLLAAVLLSVVLLSVLGGGVGVVELAIGLVLFLAAGTLIVRAGVRRAHAAR